MSVIRWEEPPTHRTRDLWMHVVDELKARPGDWALVSENVSAKYLHQSVKRQLTKHGCETRTRKMEGGHSVWARWPVNEVIDDHDGPSRSGQSTA